MADNKLQVLFITEFLPWPLTSGGRIRSYHILRQVASKHKVTLVAACHDEVEEHFKGFIDDLHALTIQPKSKIKKALGALLTLGSPNPYLLAYSHFQKQLAETIQQLVKKNNYDLVHLDHLDAAIYLPFCGNIPVYLDQHNFETKLFQSVRDNTTNFILRRYIEQQLKKLSKFEAEILRKSNAIGSVSSNDASLMAEIVDHKKIDVVPNGVDLDFFDIEKKPLPFRVVTIGSLDWQPNVEGLIWFLDKTWPLVVDQCPQATFQIVGRSPPKSLLDRASDKILIAASVPDIRNYASQAAAFVIPLFSGGGTRLKALEAMAMRMPLVSTPTGVEGINCKDGEHVFIAETPTAFANKVVEVLNDQKMAMTIAEKARQLMEDQYSWDAIGNKLDKIYHRLVSDIRGS